jgi:DnaJ-class molecular chaperone
VLYSVKENANKSEIIASYRKLAREWHPDKNQHRAAQADKEFSAIAHAYEILKDDASRRNYDYALRHPELFAYNQAKYFYTQFYSRHVKVCSSWTSFQSVHGATQRHPTPPFCAVQPCSRLAICPLGLECV